MKIAVLASGNGSNFQAIMDNVKNGFIPAEIALLVSDNDTAYALKRAKDAGVETYTLNPKDFDSREKYDKALVGKFKEKGIGLIVLAGFMRILSPYLVKEYSGKILNVHPALLPAFKGSHGVKDALEYGVKITGPTVHFVDKELDHGPIILQEAISVSDDDTEETLLRKMHQKEHDIYPRAVKLFVEGMLEINGRKVSIKE